MPFEVKSFLDGEIGAELSRNKVPGAIVSVVGDGRLIFAGGYGSADPNKAVPYKQTRHCSVSAR
jgi:CubicO group peptidase (beta-lactamase class C family)